MTEKIKSAEIVETQNVNHLPEELDNDTVIFSYGSLLEHEKLRELLKTRGEFQILETTNLAEAARLAQSNQKDIVILKNVRLENVRVSIVTETILKRWYIESGGEFETQPEAETASPETWQSLFLYARPARSEERGKTLSGGLICNLSKEELSVLDKYEWTPVLKRERTPELKIGKRVFIPKHITFYAGAESTGDLTTEEKAERARLLNLNRTPGRQSPQARWQRDVRPKRH